MTFIDIGTIWITAAFKENSLEMSPPATVRKCFSMFSRSDFRRHGGRHRDGGGPGNVDPTTGLPKISTDSWMGENTAELSLRLVLDEGRPKGVRYGSQANVVIYPETIRSPMRSAASGSGYFRS